jgi:hypothetical protein
MVWNFGTRVIQISGIHLAVKVQILTEEFAVDLGSGLCWGKPIILCLRPVTNAFQLKIHRAEMQSRFMCSAFSAVVL